MTCIAYFGGKMLKLQGLEGPNKDLKSNNSSVFSLRACFGLCQQTYDSFCNIAEAGVKDAPFNNFTAFAV
jgi:hypothetical protein